MRSCCVVSRGIDAARRFVEQMVYRRALHACTHASVGMYSLIHRMVIRETDSWGPVDKVAPTYFTVVGPIQTRHPAGRLKWEGIIPEPLQNL
jgi:hypothetical protein